MDDQHTKSFDLYQKAFWNSLNDSGSNIDKKFASISKTHDLVHTCISLNSNAVAAARWGIFKDAPEDGSKTPTTKGKQFGKGYKKASIRSRANIRKRLSHHVKTDVSNVVELTDHAGLEIFNNAGEQLHMPDFMRLIVQDVSVFGVSYWALYRNSGGPNQQTNPLEVPYGIKALAPWNVQPQLDLEGKVEFYYYYNDSDAKLKENALRLDLWDVVEFRWPDIEARYSAGDSPLKSLKSKLDISIAYDHWLAYTIKNRSRPDYQVMISGQTSEALVKRFQKQLKDQFGGDESGGPVVTGEDVAFKSLPTTATDMGPLAIDDKVAKAILGAFHIPPSMIANDPTHNNAETSIQLWREHAILPFLNMIEDNINRSIFSLFNDGSFIAFDNPIPEDEAFELEQQKVEDDRWNKAGALGVLLVNEVRTHLGLDEIEGGDVLILSTRQQYQDPANLDADTATDESTGKPVDADSSGETDADSDENTPVSDDNSKSFDVDVFIKINAEVVAGRLPRAAGISVASKALGVSEDVARNLVGYAPENPAKGHQTADKQPKTETKAAVKSPANDPTAKFVHNPDALANMEKEVQTFAKQQQADVMKQIHAHQKKSLHLKAGDQLPDEFVPVDSWDDDLAYRIQPVAEIEAKTAANGQQQALTRVGASPDSFGVVPAQVEKAIDKRSLKFAASTNQTTLLALNDALDTLKKEVDDATYAGDPIADITDRVQSVFSNLSDSRAENIARSETSYAVHAGQVLSAKASGIVSGFKYLVSDDACDRICQPHADQTIDIDDYDMSGDIDDEDTLPFHPNCTCSMQNVIDYSALNDDSEDDDSEDNQESE